MGNLPENVGYCHHFCKESNQGHSEKQGVFTRVVKKGGVEEREYYCGLGFRDCLLPHLCSKLDEIGIKSAEALQMAYEDRPTTF